jgi:hypothetical protein
MAHSAPARSSEQPTGRHSSLAALGASTAVAVLAVVMFGIVGHGTPDPARQDDSVPVGPQDRHVEVYVPVEPADDSRWEAFLAELPSTIPRSRARAAGEQACLMLRGNAGEDAALKAVLRAGVQADKAEQVLEASRRLICP